MIKSLVSRRPWFMALFLGAVAVALLLGPEKGEAVCVSGQQQETVSCPGSCTPSDTLNACNSTCNPDNGGRPCETHAEPRCGYCEQTLQVFEADLAQASCACN